MCLRRTRGYLAAFVVLLLVFSIGTAPELATALSPPETFHLTVGGAKLELQEVDVGAKFGCSERTRYVGVVLKSHGIVRWSFNIDDLESMARAGCYTEANETRIVGVAVPSDTEALWVVDTLICGAGSCAGSAVTVFRFSTKFARIDPTTGLYERGSVYEVISEGLGRGGIRFNFPRLVLYVNNGYKECPSHFTRMIYEWTRIDNYEKFILVSAIAYTSHICGYNPNSPPDPE